MTPDCSVEIRAITSFQLAKGRSNSSDVNEGQIVKENPFFPKVSSSLAC